MSVIALDCRASLREALERYELCPEHKDCGSCAGCQKRSAEGPKNRCMYCHRKTPSTMEELHAWASEDAEETCWTGWGSMDPHCPNVTIDRLQETLQEIHTLVFSGIDPRITIASIKTALERAGVRDKNL